MNSALFDLAEYTNRSIFLTGKAGTGKTTFLNNFTRKTRKKFIVVAPTGIAAINAGGVTIHSMFGLPLRPFLPTADRIDGNLGNNIADLHQHFKYRKDKLKLLREVEIIIIDEVSMLRADVLDMMDFALRHIRRNQQKFGGVQMLFIGDLYQLPPVVRDENILSQYYASPFFFDSLALKELSLITVELTTVYRQKDEHFLDILNAVRDGRRDEIDFELLNSRYKPDFEPQDEPYVYLTSHNRMADEINRRELERLPGDSFFYKAKVTGDFKDTQFPNEESLELRVGAQIMFIRNDASSDKRYFNGKLAQVVHLTYDEITVQIDGSDEDYKLKRETWEQKKYSLDSDKNIQEEVLGSFEQFPIRLAWAVTIHKSQGLTFDRLIIDAGKSFASGQVYVALSRCRTLEGIVLKSKITPEIIHSDHRVEQFQENTHANDRLDEILNGEKYDFAVHKVLRYTDLHWIPDAVTDWYISTKSSRVIDTTKAEQLFFILKKESDSLSQIYGKFVKVCLQKLRKIGDDEGTWQEIEDKAKGAVNFFFINVNEKIFIPLKDFYAETKGVKGLKQYNEQLKTTLDDLEDYLNSLKSVHLLEKKLLEEKNDVKISMATAKVPTHILTFQLFESGKTVPEIAKERGLVKETVYGHLVKFAEQGVLDLKRLITQEKMDVFRQQFEKDPKPATITEWKNTLPDGFEFHEIRLLLGHHEYLKNRNEKV